MATLSLVVCFARHRSGLSSRRRRGQRRVSRAKLGRKLPCVLRRSFSPSNPGGVPAVRGRRKGQGEQDWNGQLPSLENECLSLHLGRSLARSLALEWRPASNLDLEGPTLLNARAHINQIPSNLGKKTPQFNLSFRCALLCRYLPSASPPSNFLVTA